MLQTIDAVFDGEVFRPEHAMTLVPHRRYRITVEDIAEAESPNAWDVLDTLAGTVVAPEDWAADNDRYLYGTPKRQDEDRQ
jgi:3-methyladenine DNA glycosylase AlkD